MEKLRILLASPVKQKKEILKYFLQAIVRSEKSSFNLDYMFADDGNDHDLLEQFASENANVRILKGNSEDSYHCDEYAHHWTESAVWRVAANKDLFIKTAAEENYDFLFLIDSDICLQPRTMEHLVTLNKDIVSEVFWTQWNPEATYLPNVWIKDLYTIYPSKINEQLSRRDIKKRTKNFLSMLSTPGTYEVGGLGACTLISKNALNKGISFKEIHNVSFWGEDRHFCIRAVALGLELWADTHHPPFHIYRESNLAIYQDMLSKL